MKTKPKSAATREVSARGVALDLLARVLEQKRPLEEAFERHPDLPKLENRDRQFVRALTSATLRHLGRIDRIIALCMERPLPNKARAVTDILRLGAAQLLVLGTPAHAAVDSAVALTAQLGGAAGYKGLVNAVLRRIAGEGEALLAQVPPGVASLPDWLWASWVWTYGEEQAAKIAGALLDEPPLDFSVKRPAERAQWAEALHARVMPGGSLRRAAHDPERPQRLDEAPGFAEGAWWVQDFAASLPVKLLGDLVGKRVLDLCAAPGGKTMQLAAAGAIVTALDRSEDRLQRLQQNLDRLGLSAECAAADATRWDAAGDFDIVLLDAPCSSTGTLRRHPDVAWLKDPRDIKKLAAAQNRLIDAAVRLTRPGGTVLYCVCSLQPEEGPERIAAALARHESLRRAPLTEAEVFGLREVLTPEGDLRTLPCHLASEGGMDGFYAARLVKAD
ncbi:RsmB/NOP family class I SAM-dependent RNA methyltransferase [Dongia sedimenti]|uniref:Transcription antitermination factor NusB n=1 Tax=Dongia sedimenti TaxID=3064282 RepID=A0ABU0YND9_9PROT|nr:transcription antitermination factor NusB [Rhodospirillaceae bacterium R-7]